MKTKEEIVQNWLPRYTGEKLENFGEYILLTNFSNYVNMFAEWNKVEIIGQGKPMQCATADNISIINFGMGSPTAATVMDLLSAINPKAVLFLGKCGGLKKRNKLGDLILTDSSDKRRRNFQRLFSCGSTGIACFCFAKSCVHHYPGLCCGLLDRHCVHYQPPCVGT